MVDLEGRRVVVLGASAGIGRSLARAAMAGGAEVLACGRRADLLDQLVAETGGGTACAVDVSEPEQVEALAAVTSRFGPVDAVVSTIGLSPLTPLADTADEDWAQVFRTNVMGVNSVIRALRPHLCDAALVLALSSEVVGIPRWGLGAYSASKAALEASFASWRLEYPRIRFGIVGVGATVPTDFGRDFDMEILSDALEIWARHGQTQDEFMDSDELGRVLAGLLGSLLPYPGINLERVLLRSPSPVTGCAGIMKRVALD
jgi:NAD(P)-dependent dehydrogenase (short-subunit alcohol dehydrogenase family)